MSCVTIFEEGQADAWEYWVSPQDGAVCYSLFLFSNIFVSSVVSVVFWKGSQVRGNICPTQISNSCAYVLGLLAPQSWAP